MRGAERLMRGAERLMRGASGSCVAPSGSRAGWPVLRLERRHREVLRVAGGELRADSDRGGGDKAVSLAERDASLRMISAPAPREIALGEAERSKAQASQEAGHHGLLAAAGSAQDLLDVDRAYPRNVPCVSQRSNARGGGKAAQRVDQNRRVEQQRQALSNTSGVPGPLCPDPACRIDVPLVLLVCERSEPCFDVFPAPFVLERPANRLGYERAATPPADAPIELPDELVVERYVQTHGHNITHKRDRSRPNCSARARQGRRGAKAAQTRPGLHRRRAIAGSAPAETWHRRGGRLDLSRASPERETTLKLTLPRGASWAAVKPRVLI